MDITTKTKTDCIGGFPYADPSCKGCGKTLELKNAWMTDGCPCNTPLGINSMNETRWRLLMQLQQNQSRSIEALMKRAGIPDGKPIPMPFQNMAAHQQRVVIEKAELDSRIEKLSSFRGTPEFQAIIPQEQKRLIDQLQIMREYSHILAERILHFEND